MNDILANPNIPWNYTHLSSNMYISLNDIINNPQIKWNYKYLSYNNNLTGGNND